VRGTGTSGYVQTNKFNLRGGPDRRETERRGHGKEGSQKGHEVKPNKDIIDHNRKRELEVKVMEYRIQLEDDELPDDEIESKVEQYRMELIEKENAGDGVDKREEGKLDDTHEIAARKVKQMEKMRDALGFREDIVEGEAFDRELQQRRKEERIAERKRREEERIQREIEREKELERREREIRKAHEAGYYEKHERPDRYDGDVGAHSSDSYTSGSSLSRSPPRRRRTRSYSRSRSRSYSRSRSRSR